MKMSRCPCPPLSVTIFLIHLIKVLVDLFVLFLSLSVCIIIAIQSFCLITVSFGSQALFLPGSHADRVG